MAELKAREMPSTRLARMSEKRISRGARRPRRSRSCTSSSRSMPAPSDPRGRTSTWPLELMSKKPVPQLGTL